MPGPRHTGSLTCASAPRPLVAGRFLLSGLMMTAIIAMGSSAGASEGNLLGLSDTELYRFMRQGFDRHPSILLAALAAAAVPAVALIAAVSRLAAGRRQRRVSRSDKPADALIAYRSAWLEVPGRRMPPVAVGEMIRIGSGDDCELAVAGTTPAGTCALIQRTSEYEFILLDVSAGEAYLAVNGARSGRCRLSDGDRIEIGSARLVFRTGEAVPMALQTQDA